MAATTAREAGRVKDIFAKEGSRALGLGVTRLGSQIGAEIDRHNTAQWIGHGAATYSSLYGDLTQQWNELASKSNPNDTSIMQGFQEQTLGPALEKFQKAFDGAPDKAQSWALTRTDEMRQHFVQKMSADMGTRAGQAVHLNLSTLERNYSNTVMNDPSSLPHVVESIKGDVGAMIAANPYLSAGDAARIQAELVPKVTKAVGQAAFYGMAKANPEEAKQALVKGDFNDYLDAAEIVRAGKFADEVITQKRVQDEHKRVTEDREGQRARAEALDSYYRKILTGQSIAGYETDLSIGAPERREITSFAHQHLVQLRDRKENTPHPTTYRQLLQGMFDQADSDPNNLSVKPIRDAFAAGKLNPREEAELEQRFNALDRPLEKNFNKQVAVAERTLRGSIMGEVMARTQPEQFTGVLNQMEKDAHDKLEAERKKPNGDVNKLLDPQSPDYLFSPAIIRSYLTPSKKVIQDQADTERKGAVDIAAERSKVAAAIAGGVPEAAAKARFKERTGQDFSASAVINLDVAKKIPPDTYEEFDAQQNALKPAVIAHGWEWEPDRWNYSVNEAGNLQRELSPGRRYLKEMFPGLVAHRKAMEGR